MIVGVPKETLPGEKRAALVPADIPALRKAGMDVLVESGVGIEAGYPDAAYQEKGADLTQEQADVYARADVILKVRSAGACRPVFSEELKLLRSGQALISFLEPLWEPQLINDLAERGVTAFAMELMPRISRAQSMDALSAMANIAGYKAVLVAASTLPRMFPMLMTAAGTITPARVFVIGAGVAGLQAIATAKRLGAKIEAYDVRSAVKDQVQSVGGTFVEVPLDTSTSEGTGGYAKEQTEDFLTRQRAFMAEVAARSDVIITTAAIPGRKSPLLLTRDAVQAMQPSSVIIDLAAERGGNCELTRLDEEVVEHHVTILGPGNLPASVPYHASQMYSRNVTTFLRHMVKEGALQLDTEDQIIGDTMVSHDGQVTSARIRELLGVEAPTQ